MQNEKQAVNTFNKGLNFDLNPIGTPNDVLTDCVNGTFITFNGDEFMIQHDAGNTKIAVPGSGYVALSEGFYPIGIKEFGGVLYIVSAKDPDIIPMEYDPEDSYDENEVIVTAEGLYYVSLEDDNLFPLPLVTNEHWKKIGTEKDFKNKYGYIEFGSYPSPEVLNTEITDGTVEFFIENVETTNPTVFKNLLYNPKVINTINFSGGTYTKFNFDSYLILENVSYEVFVDLVKRTDYDNKKIYKVKLLQQLNNGFIDLTDDVWKKYAYYIKETLSEDLNTGGSNKYWFTDNTFKYYCPNNFKGKLAISIELEPYDYFYLTNITKRFDSTNYTIEFQIDSYEYAGWGTNTGAIRIFYTLDGSEPMVNPSNGYIVTTSVSSATMVISGSHANKVLKYKIIPMFYFDDVLVPYEDLPVEFLNQHTISGQTLVTDESEKYIVEIDSSSSVTSESLITYARITLKDIDGNKLTIEFDITLYKYQFYLLGSPEPTYALGTYEINSAGMATNVIFSETLELDPIYYQQYISTLIENLKVQGDISDWGYSYLTVEVNKITGTVPIKVIQNGTELLRTNPNLGPYYDFRVLNGVPFTISTRSGLGFDTNTDYNYTDTIMSDTSISFGLVTDLSIVTQVTGDPGNELYSDYINITVDMFGTAVSPTRFVLTQTNPTYGSASEYSLDTGWSGPILNYTYESSWPSYSLVFSNTGVNTYDNLSGLTIAIEGDNNIFLKTNTITT